MLIPIMPPPGLNSDDTTFASEARWVDGDGFRFVGGFPETVGFQSDSFFVPENETREAYALHCFENGGTTYVAWGFSTQLAIGGLFVSSPVHPTDRLSTDCPPTKHWSLRTFGSTLMAVPRGGTLYAWTGSGNATPVSNAPDRINCMLVTPERQVIAFGCNEEISGVFNGLCIRGSDIEDYEDWTTSPANNVFEHILEGGGEIVAAELIANYVVVWTTTSMFVGQFLGDPNQTYRFDRVEDGIGCIGQDAVTVMGATAYWMTPGLAFYQWSPGSLPTQIPCPISRDFSDNANIHRVNPVRAVALRRSGEVWWFYPDSRDSAMQPSRYIAYSTRESHTASRPVWFRGSQTMTGIMIAPALDAVNAAFGIQPPEAYLARLNTGFLEFVRWSVSDTKVAALGAEKYIKSGGIYLDNSRRRIMIREVIPDFEFQEGPVQLTLEVKDRPNDALATRGPYEITTSNSRTSLRASAKIVALKWSTPSPLRLGKPLLDIVPLGER